MLPCLSTSSTIVCLDGTKPRVIRARWWNTFFHTEWPPCSCESHRILLFYRMHLMLVAHRQDQVRVEASDAQQQQSLQSTSEQTVWFSLCFVFFVVYATKCTILPAIALPPIYSGVSAFRAKYAKTLPAKQLVPEADGSVSHGQHVSSYVRRGTPSTVVVLHRMRFFPALGMTRPMQHRDHLGHAPRIPSKVHNQQPICGLAHVEKLSARGVLVASRRRRGGENRNKTETKDFA